MAFPKKKDAEQKMLVVKAPNFKIFETEIVGTSPYVGERFSAKTKGEMLAKHMKGQQGDSEATKHEKKDPDALVKEASHMSPEGWYGIPASAFRNAMITVCGISGVVIKDTKLCVFIVEDGYDDEEPLTGLVRITKGEPEKFIFPTRNATGVPDIRCRPMWKPGWRATVHIRYDADQMTEDSIANLLVRAGIQCGIGAGRNFSKKSNGMGWGCFAMAEPEKSKKKKE